MTTTYTDPGELVDVVASHVGVDACELLHNDKRPEIRPPRLLLWATLRCAGLSFPAIGRAVNRDPVTVMVGLRDDRIDWSEAATLYLSVRTP